MSFLHLFWYCHACGLLNVSYLNQITNPTPLPNATLTIGAAARNPNYWGSRVYPNYLGSRTQPYLSGLLHSTLTIGAAVCNPNSWGSLGLGSCGLRYTLAAWALPLQFGLHAHGLGFALTTIK